MKGMLVSMAAPLGIGVALLYFFPLGMSAENYFRWERQAHEGQYARFIVGLVPAMVGQHCMVAPDVVNFQG